MSTPPPPGADDAQVDSPRPQRKNRNKEPASSGSEDNANNEQWTTAPKDTAPVTGEDNAEDTQAVSVVKGTAPVHVAEDASDSDSELSEDPAPCAGRTLTNRARDPRETFEPHDTDPDLIEGTIKIKLPDGSGWYILKWDVYEKRDLDKIPEDVKKRYKSTDCIFLPPMGPAKAPAKVKPRKGREEPKWVRDLSVEYRWTRYHPAKKITEIFEPKFVFRRFNAWTHAYEHVYVGMKKLANIDPNNADWMTEYNKWVDQIHRRKDADYVQEKYRNHWSVAEQRTMLRGFNEYIHANGRDSFRKMSDEDLQPILDAINAVGGMNRRIDALRGQFISAHAKKNPKVAFLRDTAQSYVDRIKVGEAIPDEERYPEHAIPESEFPREEVASKVKAKPKRPKKDKSSTLFHGGVSMAIQSMDDTSEVEIVPWTVDMAAAMWNARNESSSPAPKKRASKKRKRGSDVEEEEPIVLPDDDSEGQAEDADAADEEEHVERQPFMYTPDEDDMVDEDAPSDDAEEPDDLPPSKKPRLAEDAVAFAQRAINGDDDDEDMSPPPSDIEH
jgi:hypothetical protein